MPMTLYHGPAGAGKTGCLVRQIAKDHLRDHPLDSFFLVVPDTSLVDWHQKILLETSGKKGILLGNAILSANQFLYFLLKRSLPRVHRATKSLSRMLVRRLLFEHDYPAFLNQRDFSGIISQLVSILYRLKRSGLSPEKTRRLFARFMTPELNDLCLLFRDYQDYLGNINFVDEGDLTLTSLKLLKEKKIHWPDSLKAVYFDRLFPMTLGQREILMALKEAYPQLELTISYSFDYKDEDDSFFSPSYQFLGTLLDKSEYFHYTKTEKKRGLGAVSDPAREIAVVTQRVIEECQRGASPDGIMVVIPNDSFYHQNLVESLKSKGIPCHETYAPPLSRFKKIIRDSSLSEAIALSHRKESDGLRDSLAAFKAWEDFELRWDFEHNLVCEGIHDEDTREAWKSEDATWASLPARPSRGGVRVLPLAEACGHDCEILYVLGYTDAHYPTRMPDPPFFTIEMLHQPELREILEGPAYQWGLASRQLKQVLGRASQAIQITYPRIDWSGREQFVSRLTDLSPFSHVESPISTTREARQRQIRFPQIQKNTLSTTELETYLKCPYQYYAQYHLKLGKKEKSDIEVPSDVRGSFVHRVLHLFFRRTEALYRDAVDYDLYVAKLVDTISPLVDEEKDRDRGLKHLEPAITEDFCLRVTEVLSEFVKKEIGLIREGKKRTLPRHFEWSFGSGETRPLKIHTEGTSIFVTGRIDRIDVDDNQRIFSVIDYKTGELESSVRIKKGESIQIPIYLMAVQTLLLQKYRPTGGFLISLKDLNKRGGLALKGGGEEDLLAKACHLDQTEWDQLTTKIHQQVGEIVKNIREGHFDPKPREPSLCRFCDYRDICHYKPQ